MIATSWTPPFRRSSALAALAFVIGNVGPAHAADYPGAPASVVAAYVEADGAGLALDGKATEKLLRYTNWKAAPGGDAFTIIASYEIGEVGWTGDRASVQIIYAVLGTLEGHVFKPNSAREEVVFDVVKANRRWKITGPKRPPHLTVAAAITTFETDGTRDDPAHRAALKALRAFE